MGGRPRSFVLATLTALGILLYATVIDLPLSANPVGLLIHASGSQHVELQIYDLNGQPIFDSGIVLGQTLQWNLQNNSGQLVANGVYLYRVTVWDAAGHTTASPIKELFVLR